MDPVKTSLQWRVACMARSVSGLKLKAAGSNCSHCEGQTRWTSASCALLCGRGITSSVMS